MQKSYYSYLYLITDAKILLPKIRTYQPDAIVAIARGGWSLAQILSESLELRQLYSINAILYEQQHKNNACKVFNIPDLSAVNKVVIVDDIVDSGETMRAVVDKLSAAYPHCQFKIASIFYKTDALIIPDWKVRQTHDWIEFFWEVDLLKSEQST